jgi:hypothetical protein
MPVKPLTEQEFQNNINPNKKASAAKVKAPIDNKPPLKQQYSTDQDVFARSLDPSHPDYRRHLLPSRGFFYEEKKDLVFRALRVGDLKKIQHFLNTNNISHLIDAIQNCVEEGYNIRELTLDDFMYVVFRVVFDSHPKPEYKFVWSSFYGNDGEEVITPATLETFDLDYKRLLEELPEFRELGLTPCLVKSYEALHNNRFKEEDDTTWDQEKTWLYEEVACYLDEASLEDQLSRAETMPLKSPEFQKLKLFKQLSKHSIRTEITATDKKFNPETAITVLKERINSLRIIQADARAVS